MKKILLSIVAAASLAVLCAPATAAMNPFMDVPASHWAYDAVAQLAARGVISGYPDGTYKGARPTTRYEMASALARALAVIDMEKASAQDVEMLKRLVVEFKDELDALGVKVDSIDSRLAVMESDLGGWAISGVFRFDAKWGNKNGLYADFQDNANGVGGDLEGRRMVGRSQFDLNKYHIDLRKYINPTTAFYARLGSRSVGSSDEGNMSFLRYYVATYLPMLKSTLMVGKAELEWERDIDFVAPGNESFVGRLEGNMIALLGDFGKLNYTIAAARMSDSHGTPEQISKDFGQFNPELEEQQAIIGKFDYQFSERFRAGLLAYYLFSSSDEKTYQGQEFDISTLTLGFYAGYKFTPNVEFKGIYYHQSQGDYWRDRAQGSYYGMAVDPARAPAGLILDENGNPKTVGDDKAKMWRVILDVKQEALNFTSLWLEYGQMDNNFWRAGQNASYGDMGHNILNRNYMPLNTNTTKFYGARADQRWNDKWRTFVSYWRADYDTDGWDAVSTWGLGVAYRLNPAVEFELAYDHVESGYNRRAFGSPRGVVPCAFDANDELVRFRTVVSF